MRFLTTLLAALPLAAAAPLNKAPRGAEVVTGKYIAVMKKEASDSVHTSSVETVSSILGSAPESTFNLGKFKGFAFSADEAQLSQVQNMADVAYVEPEIIMRISNTQSNSPWGLGRISHKSTSNSQYSSYIYDASAGAGTYCKFLGLELLLAGMSG